MGTVFFAEQIAVGNRPVALKVLLRKLLDDPEFLLRFQNEAASTGCIHHPNVVTIYESGQADDGTPYLAMEYLEGKTLRQALEARGALPVAECVEILQQVARGLNAAHRLGTIHRDLKPDNIFLTRGDEGELVVKVVDFGIAKLRESATHTLTGTVLGTPAYMSFEQASGMRSDELDARSDIYSLGVVVYEMLTGRVPFHSDTPLGYVRKHMMEEPPPFRAVAPGLPVPPQVENAVMKALRKERDERYASALEFARDLAVAAKPQPQKPLPVPSPTSVVQSAPAVAERSPAGPGPAKAEPRPETAPDVSPPVPSPGKLQPRRLAPAPALEPPSRTKYIVLALGALVLVAVGVWYLSRPSEQPRTTENASSETPAKPAAAPAGMVYIPGGTFMMGRDKAADPEETPAHSVTVAQFYLDKTPVTNSAFARFDQRHAATPADQPATDVSWNEAQAYCQSKGERLPSEAEWESAARGTDGRLYPWGNTFSVGLVNSSDVGLGHPEAVGIRPHSASPFGVLDMSGNVWQWCADDYRPYSGHQPTFKIPALAKVIRGGSFKSDKDHVTATTRNLDLATSRSPTIGFRCAK
jgi:serine/threonine-protein kinase